MRVPLADRNHVRNEVELHIRFALWMRQCSGRAAPRDVAERFCLSYATSYRWMSAWRAANGLPPLAEANPSYRNRKRK